MIAAFITILAVIAFCFGIAMLVEKRSDRKKAEAKQAELRDIDSGKAEETPKAKKPTKKSK